MTSKVNNSALLSYIKKSDSKILPSLEQLKGAGHTDFQQIDELDSNSEEYQKVLSHYFYGETDEEVAIVSVHFVRVY